MAGSAQSANQFPLIWIIKDDTEALQSNSPQALWHQELVLWKTVFPRTGAAWGRAGAWLVSGQFKCTTFTVYFIIITSAPPQTITH